MSVASKPTPESVGMGNERVRQRAYCRQHWLGMDVPAERKAAADAVRQRYFTTAMEHHKAAIRIYELLTSPEHPTASGSHPVGQISRHIQLLLAYSTLWDGFRYIYNAACYTNFARGEAEAEPIEGERAKIDRVLREPILPEVEVAAITMLRNGETAGGAIQRLIGRHSRELEQIDGEAHNVTITDMDAYMQGVALPIATAAGRPWELWGIRALDDSGQPVEPDVAPAPVAYRAAIKWLCYQIR